jgi:small subunit ribosomal protein S16
MALIIRLRQQGKNNRRSFRLVVADERSPRDGKYLEKLGYYDPHSEDGLVNLDFERVEYWLNNGALISDRAKSLVMQKAPEVIQKYSEKKELQKAKRRKSNRA